VDIDINTDAGQVTALAKAVFSTGPQILPTPEGRQFLVMPEGMQHLDVTPKNGERTLPPDHTRQTVTLQTLASLTAYGVKFRTDTTTLFGDVDHNTIVAPIDYHGADKASLVAHVAKLVLPYSVEWKTWNDVDGKLMDQLTFARFIEENIDDIVDPTGADLLEAVSDIRSAQAAEFKGRIKTGSDNIDFDYSEATELSTRPGGLVLPKRLHLSIPVYFGDSSVSVIANLRHKVEGGKLSLGVALHRKEHVRQAQFQQHVLTAADAIDCLAVLGRFETSR
jgi:uncharacterized protein YfdQ (DUF2303 family)